MSSEAKQIAETNGHQIWWQLAILVCVSIVAVYVGSAFDERVQQYMPEERTLASVYNKKPSGLSGLLELVRRVGLPNRTWQLPYRQLKSARGMLVIISPIKTPQDFETDQILDWVKAGNDLIYLDHFSFKLSRKILTRLGLDISDNNDVNEVKVAVDQQKPEFSHVSSLVVRADTLLDGGASEVSYKGQNVFSLLKHGKGRILIGTAPTFCINRRLSDPYTWSNFQFLINWMSTASGEIMFDERCHGFTGAGNVFVVLARSAWGAIFAQGLLILTVAVFCATQRFGAARALLNERKISNLEFINGLSNAYRRAKANSAILEITGLNLRNRICKLLSVSPHETTDKVLDAWRLRMEQVPEATTLKDSLPEFLSKLDQTLKQPHVSDTQFKGLIATCDKIGGELSEIFATPSKKG